MNKIKLGMVDDHRLFRSGIAAMLKYQEDFDLIFEAEDGIDMIDKVKADNLPDIILMDVNMPRMNGIAATEWLRSNFPQIKVLVLSMIADVERVLSMIRLGVKGYLLKDSQPGEFEEAIRQVYNGETYYPAFVTKILVDKFSGSNENLSLNSREIEFLKLAGTELTYKEIAEAMCISVRTAEGYRESLFEKINVKSRVGLVLYAIKNKLIEFETNTGKAQ